MTTLDQTAFKQLEAENRLFNPVFKGATGIPGRFGFRGEIAIKFSPQLADEARPPEITADQVIAIAQEGEAGLGFLTAFLLSFEYLELLAEALEGVLIPEGKYFLFCDNIDLSKRYQVACNGATFYILPISEATVYNEMLELLYLERNDLKRLNTAGKVDKVADKALSFSDTFPAISYEEGLALMGPVRDPGENRPV
ncbi:MAG: hypothetical protein P8164_00215 [Gammaproteobacteria bacterium]